MRKKNCHRKEWLIFGILFFTLSGLKAENEQWSKPDKIDRQGNDWVPVAGDCPSCKPNSDLSSQPSNDQIRKVLDGPVPSALNFPQSNSQFQLHKQPQPRLLNNGPPPNNYHPQPQLFGKQENKRQYYPPVPQQKLPYPQFNSPISFQQPFLQFNSNPYVFQKPNEAEKYFVDPYKTPYSFPQQIFLPQNNNYQFTFQGQQQPKFQQHQKPSEQYQTTTVAPRSIASPKIRFPDKKPEAPELQLLYVPIEALQRGRTIKNPFQQPQDVVPHLPPQYNSNVPHIPPQFTSTKSSPQHTTPYPFQLPSGNGGSNQFTFPTYSTKLQEYTTPQYRQQFYQDKKPNAPPQYPVGSQYPTAPVGSQYPIGSQQYPFASQQYPNYPPPPPLPPSIYFPMHDNSFPQKPIAPEVPAYSSQVPAVPVPSKEIEPPIYKEYLSQDFHFTNNKEIPSQQFNNFGSPSTPRFGSPSTASTPPQFVSTTESYPQYTKEQNLFQTSPQQFSTTTATPTTKQDLQSTNNFHSNPATQYKDFSDVRYVTNSVEPPYFSPNQLHIQNPSGLRSGAIPAQNAQQLYTFSTSIQTLPPSNPTTSLPPESTTTTYLEHPTYPPPHQPPLSVYMEKYHNSKVIDILNLLKTSKTIPVLDTIETDAPQVFVGPSELQVPNGYVKFDLPYLSSLDTNRIERMIDHLPFFVAPLNFKPPNGYSKVPFPAPHIGSVVISNSTAFNDLLHDKSQNKYPTIKISSSSSAFLPNSEIPTSTQQSFSSDPNSFLYSPSIPSEFSYITPPAPSTASRGHSHRIATTTTAAASTEYPRRNTQRHRRPVQRGKTTTTTESYVENTSRYTTSAPEAYFDTSSNPPSETAFEPRNPSFNNSSEYFYQNGPPTKVEPIFLEYYPPKEQTSESIPNNNHYLNQELLPPNQNNQNFDFQNNINGFSNLQNNNEITQNQSSSSENYDIEKNNSQTFNSDLIPKENPTFPPTNTGGFNGEYYNKNNQYNPYIENNQQNLSSEVPILSESSPKNHTDTDPYFQAGLNFQNVKSIAEFKPTILKESISQPAAPQYPVPSSEPDQYIAYQPWSQKNQQESNPSAPGVGNDYQTLSPIGSNQNHESTATVPTGAENIQTSGPGFENGFNPEISKISSESTTESSTEIPSTSAYRSRVKHKNRYTKQSSIPTVSTRDSDVTSTSELPSSSSVPGVFNKISPTRQYSKYNKHRGSTLESTETAADTSSTRNPEIRTLATRRRRPLRPSTTTPTTSLDDSSISTEISTTVSKSVRTRFSRPTAVPSTESSVIRARARRPISTSTNAGDTATSAASVVTVMPNLEWESSYINNNFAPSASGSNEISPVDTKPGLKHSRTQWNELTQVGKNYNYFKPSAAESDSQVTKDSNSVTDDNGRSIENYKNGEISENKLTENFGDKNNVTDEVKIELKEEQSKQRFLEKDEQESQKKYDLQDEKKGVQGRRRGAWVKRVRVKRPQDVLETAESQNLAHVSDNSIKTSNNKHNIVSKSEDYLIKDKVNDIISETKISNNEDDNESKTETISIQNNQNENYTSEFTNNSPASNSSNLEEIHQDFTDMLTELLSDTKDNNNNNLFNKNNNLSDNFEENDNHNSQSSTEISEDESDQAISDENISFDLSSSDDHDEKIISSTTTEKIVKMINSEIVEITSSSQSETTTEDLSNETVPSKILGTSTTTEISLETEICYKGKCVKSKRSKATDLEPAE